MQFQDRCWCSIQTSCFLFRGAGYPPGKPRFYHLKVGIFFLWSNICIWNLCGRHGDNILAGVAQFKHGGRKGMEMLTGFSYSHAGYLLHCIIRGVCALFYTLLVCFLTLALTLFTLAKMLVVYLFRSLATLSFRLLAGIILGALAIVLVIAILGIYASSFAFSSI